MLKKCIIFCGMLSMLFILSCEKEENFEPVAETVTEQEDCFFTNECLSLRTRNKGRSENLDSNVDLIMDYFVDNPHEKNKTENKYGIPVWDFVNTSQVNGGVLVTLPMVKPNKGHTEAILLVLVNDQLELGFNVMERKKLDKFNKKNKNKAIQTAISQELALIQFLIADKTIFDYTDCSMIDLLVSISSNSRTVESSRTDECYWSWESDEECWSIEVYGTDGNPIGDPMTECETVYDYEIICNGSSVPPTESEDPNGGDSGAGGGTAPTIPVDDIFDVTADLELIEAFMCLYDLFVNGNNSLFCNTLGPFYDPLDFTLKFDEIQNISSAYQVADGKTKKTGSNEITIYINEQHNSPLAMASTILHEGIHAAIIAYLDNNGINVNLLNEENLLREYAEATNANDADHYYMVNNYINPLAEALKELDNNRLSLEHYYSFAWIGLEDYAISSSDIAHKNQYFGNSEYLAQLNASGLCR